MSTDTEAGADAPLPSARNMAVQAAADASKAPDVKVAAAPSLLDDNDKPLFAPHERLGSSPVHDWFPGVEWNFVLVWLGGVCVQSIEPEGSDAITLIIEGMDSPAASVRYTRAASWSTGDIGWFGPVVHSATEVGDLILADQAS